MRVEPPCVIYLLATLTDRNMPLDSHSLIPPSRPQFTYSFFTMQPMSYPRMDSRLLHSPCLSICHSSEWALHHLVAASPHLKVREKPSMNYQITPISAERSNFRPPFGNPKAVRRADSSLTGPLYASCPKFQLSYHPPIQSTPLKYRSQNVHPAL